MVNPAVEGSDGLSHHWQPLRRGRCDCASAAPLPAMIKPGRRLVSYVRLSSISMRALLSLLSGVSLLLLPLLVLSGCSSNDTSVDEVPAPSSLVGRYGKLKVGTYEVRLPKRRISDTGNLIIYQGGTVYLKDDEGREDRMWISDFGAKFDVAPVNLGWRGVHSEDSGEGRHCSGSLYVFESSTNNVRATFSGRCWDMGPFDHRYGYTLIEGGFHLRR